MKKRNKINKKGTLAISQIFILVIGIIAISYAVGSEARIVSAATGDTIVGSFCIKYMSSTGEQIGEYNLIGNDYTNVKIGSWQSGDGAYYLKNDGGLWYYKDPATGAWQEYGSASQISFDPRAKVAGKTCEALFASSLSGSIQEKSAELDETPSAVVPVASIISTATTIISAPSMISNDTDTLDADIPIPDTEIPEGVEPLKKNATMVKVLGGLLEVQEGSFGHIVITGFQWAGIVYGGVKVAGGWLGLEPSLTDSLAMSLGVGTFVWQALETAKKPNALGWGIATAAIIFLLTYKKETQEIIMFTCKPWDANAGGNNCDACNNQGVLPCSEYQCRSLGQACELVNKGTDEEKCVWVNKNDVEFPTIEAWDEALLNDYEYNPDNSISPPDRGVKIKYSQDTCVPAFTPLTFGIKTNEPAKCKLDILRKDNFEDMNFYFSDGLLNTEHSYSLSLPGSNALNAEGIEIENNGEYGIYVRCQDANGNSNTANFVFNFCVDKGPDTTPPLIVGTSPLNDKPVAFGQTSFITEVYINEPAECKWSHIDQNYDDMTAMDCTKANTLIADMNEQGMYTCVADLTGLKDRVENRFYFRCKDQPGADDSNRNVNVESYKYSLVGTQPLVIDSVEPSGVIKDSTDVVKLTLKAKTSAGFNQGEATCWYKEVNEDDANYVMFFETDSYQHSQDLYLPKSSYDYSIKCCDFGNNCDNETTSFSVETDISAPVVVRAYKEETYLKIITNEPAECVYDVKYENFPCDYNFEDGIKMTTIDSTNHYTDWNTQTNLYVQCKDEYGKQPAYGECSIIVRPFEIY
ncbi:hypothetical protein KAR52_03485 [Candidatus Pacearchaeota archaeon]|nr:hypothetical protein [Candidatus Pacearchaeota archaeon]